MVDLKKRKDMWVNIWVLTRCFFSPTFGSLKKPKNCCGRIEITFLEINFIFRTENYSSSSSSS